MLLHGDRVSSAARQATCPAAEGLAEQGYGDRRAAPKQVNPAQSPPSGNGKTPPNRAAQGEPEPWAPPMPFGRPGAVPAFPTRLLPGWLADWVEADAEATQTPADLAGNLVLALTGAAVARKVRVRIRPGWTEPANIMAVTSLPPGDRKSKVFADAAVPLLEHEQAERSRMAPIIAELASEHRVMELKLKALEQKVARAKDPGEGEDPAEAEQLRQDTKRLREDAKTLAKQLAQHVVPAEPQMFTDDVTPRSWASC
jgi:hypothetical protein